jgi:predicted nuclease of restriction endonuclease-like (RecB) superfamily
MIKNEIDAEYGTFLHDLKTKIRSAQLRAMLSVNAELVRLYWQIGNDLAERQKTNNWGAKVLERLAIDLKAAFPGQKGFSLTNLKYMRQLAEAWSLAQIGQQPVDQLNWSHHVVLLTKLDSAQARLWYAAKAVEQGWSRNVLALQIDSKLIERQGMAQTNFQEHLPPSDSDLAKGMLKDPVNLSFLAMEVFAHERHLQHALITDIRKFLLELGKGFSFLGEQVHIQVGADDFYADLLFYHVKLHCYVVIDLKMGEFDPRDEGQLRFYVNAVEEQMRDHVRDAPTIGLLLCRSKNDKVVEVALRGSTVAMGVATYKLGKEEKESLALDEIKSKLESTAESEPYASFQ